VHLRTCSAGKRLAIDFAVHPSPGDPMDAIYLTNRPVAL
jgi:hypothetical protein